MPEDTARALGASGMTTVEIAGKQCQVRPLGIKELTEVERDCIERYRRSYLKTFADNTDLLSNNFSIVEEFQKAAKWDIDDLPAKTAYDPASLKITKGLKKWLNEKDLVEGKVTNNQLKTLTATCLDKEMLSVKEYIELTQSNPISVNIPYVNWWITGSFEGMITFIWTCFKDNGVTRDEVAVELGNNPLLASELSREIEQLSVPTAGNG